MREGKRKEKRKIKWTIEKRKKENRKKKKEEKRGEKGQGEKECGQQQSPRRGSLNAHTGGMSLHVPFGCHTPEITYCLCRCGF